VTRLRFLALATAIILLSAVLRLADLDRYPPGLHYDEAADMLLGRDTAFYGYNPFPVVTAYSGREALFYYLSVPLLGIFGTHVMATRLTSAFLGILTVAATIALGKTLFRGQRGRFALPLWAGGFLAVNGAQVWLTRQGFRTSPQPLLEALSLWCLVVGLNKIIVHPAIPIKRIPSSLFWLAAAGFFGGAALYVYMAARVFPLWLLLPIGYVILIDRERRGRLIRATLVVLGAMGIVALPIALFYLNHADVLLDRLAQLAPGGKTVTLMDSLRLHLEMFFLRGDPLLRYNLYPGRPWFDPISGGLFVIGFIAAVIVLLRRGQGIGQRLAAVFVILCPLLIAPSVIAVGGLPPSHMRSVGMVPLVFFLPAWGAVALWESLPRLRGETVQRRLGALLGGILILALALNTWGDYQAWGQNPQVFYDSNGDYALAAHWLEKNHRPREIIYIASEYYNHPTILAANIPHHQVRWLMADQMIVPPSDGGTTQEALYIFPKAVGVNFFVPPVNITRLTGVDGQTAVTIYYLPKGDINWFQEETAPSSMTFGGVLRRWQGISIAEGETPGTLTLASSWRILQTPDRDDLAPVFRLVDAADPQREIVRANPYIEQTRRWLPTETLRLSTRLSLPSGLPPGDYRLQVAWVGRTDPTHYLPVLDGEGAFRGIWEEGGVYSRRKGDTAPEGFTLPAAAVRLSSGLVILRPPDYPAEVEQGARLPLTVDWYAETIPSDLGEVTITATGTTEGTPLTLYRREGAFPFREWAARQIVTAHYAVPIPTEMPAGGYMLTLHVGVENYDLGGLEVIRVERDFTPPENPAPVIYTFGGQIDLVAHTIQREGESLRLDLIWQARAIPEQDYTTFVHVINADGRLDNQQDKPPSRPTSRWIIGEYIRDTYIVQPGAEGYTIRIGLYVQDNGLRLPVTLVDGTPVGDFVAFPSSAVK